MKQEVFDDIIGQLDIQKNKWIYLTEFDSIILKNGIGYYPNWEHLRFLINDKREILVKHGISKPYGARLSPMHTFSWDYKQISFIPGNVIQKTKYYDTFRLPKEADIIIAYNDDKIIQTGVITKVIATGNAFSLEIAPQFSNVRNQKEYTSLSFYDPGEYNEEDCMHGDEVPGIFMKFYENHGKNTKYGVIQEKIKVKEIAAINLSISVHKKVYKVRG